MIRSSLAHPAQSTHESTGCSCFRETDEAYVPGRFQRKMHSMDQLPSFEGQYIKPDDKVPVVMRSPFRYPGGKTWLVPRVRQWLADKTTKTAELIEPFAGGGIVSLTAVFEGLAERATMVELDDRVASVWQAILGKQGEELANSIAEFDFSADSVREVLASPCNSLQDKAFATILRNRVSRGGILAPGAGLLKKGENGKGLASRWYPETLKKRILDIVGERDRIDFIMGDGVEVMRETCHRSEVSYFIDPPYTAAARRLYTEWEIDHDELFEVASNLAGDFLMTYDNDQTARSLAEKHGFEAREVVMKSTHHAQMTELLIGRDLSWLRY